MLEFTPIFNVQTVFTMRSSELTAKHRARLFSGLLAHKGQNGDWDKIFQLLRQGRYAADKAQLPDLVQKMEQGQTAVIDGLKKTGQFLPWELTVLEFGLKCGGLSQSYQRLQQHYALQQRLQQQLATALKLPTIFAMAVISALFCWMYLQQHIVLTDAINRWGLNVVVISIFSLGIYYFYNRLYSAAVKPTLISILKRIPFVNRLLTSSQRVNYFKNLNQAIAGGLPLIQSLLLSARFLPDENTTAPYQGIHGAVSSGEKLSSALSQSGVLKGVHISPLVKQPITVEKVQLHIEEAVTADFFQRWLSAASWMSLWLYLLLPVLIFINLMFIV